MSDDTTPEATVASGSQGPASSAGPANPTTTPNPVSVPPRNDSATETTAESVQRNAGGESTSESSDPTGPPKRRRRRGSRVGRNRRKPAGGGAAAGAADRAGADADDDDDEPGGHDYTAAEADRGLTTDDVADVALEEAGLTHTPRPHVGDPRSGAPKPQIGDSRPAPAADGSPNQGDGTSAPKRRRRRGGRGRGRGGAGGGAGANGGNGRPQQQAKPRDVVRADLGVGDDPIAPLDDDVLERRRGRTRKGRPAGRYLLCVSVLEGGHTHIAVLEGRSLVEHS